MSIPHGEVYCADSIEEMGKTIQAQANALAELRDGNATLRHENNVMREALRRARRALSAEHCRMGEVLEFIAKGKSDG